jgi:hypothetical protein
MKNGVVFVFLMLSVFYLNAQKWDVGLIGGINFPTLHSKEPDVAVLLKENKKYTFNGGVSVLFNCSKYLNLRSEVIYEERGWVTETIFTIDPNTGNSGKSKLNYFYPFITIPILVEGKIGNTLQVFVNTGINTSFRIGGKTITENGYIPTVFIFPEDKKPTFDFAWVGGGGIRVPVHKKFFLQTECRYYRSWTPIGVGYSFDSIIKHKGFLLNLSCYYRI